MPRARPIAAALLVALVAGAAIAGRASAPAGQGSAPADQGSAPANLSSAPPGVRAAAPPGARAVAPPGAPTSPPPGGAGRAAFPEGTAGARLAAYVAGDFAGERLERASWLKYRDWVMWTTEPAWDEAYVVRDYAIGKVAASATDATAEVSYDTLGVLDLAAFTYTPSPTRQAVPFKLLHSEGAASSPGSQARPGEPQWRIGLPMLRPHPGADAAVAFLTRMRVHHVQRRPTIDRAIAAIRADAARPAP